MILPSTAWILVVNFINVIRAHFSYERHFGGFFSMYVRTYVTYLCTKKKLPKQHSYKKRARLTFMKLTPKFFWSERSGWTEFPYLPFWCRTNMGSSIKLRCDERFMHAVTACGCVFKEITLVDSNQGNYFENATACSKRTLKSTVATQL